MANNISALIEHQFPAFYREDGQFFIEFLKHYYKWMEQTGNTLYHSRRLPEYFDIDTTSEDFIPRFREKYIPNFALLGETDKRTLIKYATDIYRSKGSIRSIKLLFKIVYGDEVEVYWPGDDVFRLSDAQFRVPKYLEVSVAENTRSFVGRQVTGVKSGATAIVESVSRRNINTSIIDVLQITTVQGNFIYNEIITADGIINGCPRVVGSLNHLTVITGGSGFAVGDIVNVVSDSIGYGGEAKVTGTTEQSGQVSYQIVDGGAGYRANGDSVFISSRILGVNNVRSYVDFVRSMLGYGPPEYTTFRPFERIEQPLVEIAFNTATGVFTPGGYIYGANSTSGVVAAGAIVTTTQTDGSYASGNVVVSDRRVQHIGLNTINDPDPVTNSFDINSTVYQRAASSATANTAVGKVFGANSTTIIVDVSFGSFVTNSVILSSLTTANAATVTSYGAGDIFINVAANTNFNIGDQVYQRNGGTTNNAVGTIIRVSGNTLIVNVTTSTGKFNNTTNVYSTNTTPGNQSVANVSYSYTNRFTDADISYYWLASPTNAAGSLNYRTATKSVAPTDRTPTATYIGGTNINYGLINISPTKSFIASELAFIRGLTSNAFANVVSVQQVGATPGSFDITEVSDTELVFYNTDLISANNISNVPFVNVLVGSTSYGFVKDSSANSSNIILEGLTVESANVGKVSAIGNINPGAFNAVDPIVALRNPWIAAYERHDYTYNLTGRNSFNFINGEDVNITLSDPITTVQFTTLTGNTSFDSTLGGESVYQVLADGTYVYGTLRSQSIGTSPKVITIGDVYALTSASGNPTTGTFGTSNNIIGVRSNATANTISSAAVSTPIKTTQGTVLSSTANTVTIRRTRFSQQDFSLLYITGASSGANGTIVSVENIADSAVYGGSALVSADAGVGTGVVATVEVLSSGFGYAPSEIVTLVKGGNPVAVTATATVNNYGRGKGYWNSTTSFVSDNKKLHDGDYYQEYSYDIRSSLTKETYERKVLDLAHVAGTKMFGSVVSTQSINTEASVANSQLSFDIAIPNAVDFPVNNVVKDEQSNTFGVVTNITLRVSNTFNGYSNVVDGAIATFNANNDVIPGVKAQFFGNTQVNEGRSLNFNTSTNFQPSINFNFNGNTDVVNTVFTTFNARTNVFSGKSLLNIGAGSVSDAKPSFNFSPNNINAGQLLTFNANTSVANSDTVTFNATTDINDSKRTFTVSNITPAYKAPFNIISTVTKTETRQVFSHYVDVFDRNEQYLAGTEQVAIGTQQIVTGTKQVFDRNEQYVARYQRTYVRTDRVVVGYNTYTTGSRKRRRTVTEPIYEDRPIFEDVPVYETRTIYRTEPVYGLETIFETRPVYKTRTIYRQEAVYRTEEYQVPNPPTLGYIPLTEASTYFSAGDYVKYTIPRSTTESFDPNTGRTIDGKVAPPGLIDGRIYKVLSANSTAIVIANPLVSETTPVEWTAVWKSRNLFRSYNQEYHDITLISGKAITGANSFISITSANSYFTVNDPIVLRPESAVNVPSTTYLKDINTAGPNSKLDYQTLTSSSGSGIFNVNIPYSTPKRYYVQSANSSGIAISATPGGPRLALTQETLTTPGYSEVLTFSFEGSNNLCGAITSASASLFTAGDEVQYRADNVSASAVAPYGLQHNKYYYVQFANATHLAISQTLGGARLVLTGGSGTSHSLVSAKTGNGAIAVVSANTYYQQGDMVVYNTNIGGTPLVGLTPGREYAIQFANASHLALTDKLKIQLSVVANTNFIVGDRIYQRVGGSPSDTAFGIIEQVNGTTVTVDTTSIVGTFVPKSNVYSSSAGNQYLISANTVVGPRITLKQGVTETHTLTGVNVIKTLEPQILGYPLASSDLVQYVVATGNTSINSTRHITLDLAANTNFVAGQLVFQRPTGSSTNNAAGTIVSVSGNTVTVNVDSYSGGFVTTSNTYSTNALLIELTANTGFYAGEQVYQRGNGVTNNAVGTIQTVTGNTLTVNVSTITGTFTTTSNVYSTNATPGNRGILSINPSIAGNQTTANVMINLSNNFVYQVSTVNSSSFSINTVSILSSIQITNVGTGYTNDEIVIVSDGSPLQPAVFKLVTDSQGSLVSANIVTRGIGYQREPAINLNRFSSGGTGGNVVTTITTSQTLTLVKNTHATGHSFVRSYLNNVVRGDATGIYANDSILYYTNSNITAIRGLTNNTIYYVDAVSNTYLSLKSTTTGARITLGASSDYTGNVRITVTANTNFNVGDYAYQRNDGTSNNASGLIIDVQGATLVVNSATTTGKFNNISNVFSTSAIAGNRAVQEIQYERTVGSTSGHNFVLTSSNNTIQTSLASSLTAGDTVLYRVESGNTAIAPLQHNTTYYVNFANTTHIALSRISGGTRVPLSKGKFETGHYLYKTSGLSAVIASSNAQSLTVGDYVRYTAQQAKTKITLAAATNFNVGDQVYQRNNGTVNNATGTIVSVSGSTITMNVQTTTGLFNLLSNVYSTNATPGNQSVTSVSFGDTLIQLSANTNFNAGDYVYQRNNGTVNNAVGLVVSVTGNVVAVNTSTIIGEFNTSSNVFSTNATPGNRSVVVVNPSPLGALSSNVFYYIQFANSTHFALSETSGGQRLLISKGSADASHRIKAFGARGTITSPIAKYFTAGDQVKYVTASGNTPLIGLSNTTTYYIESANDTHISLTTTFGGDRLDLLYSGGNEGGHWISPQNTKATIRATNQFTVGDAVTYTVGIFASPLVGLTANGTYYIEFANSTHFAISNTSGGPRADMYKSLIEDDHVFSSAGSNGTIYSSSATDFAVGDRVRYIVSAGNTAIAGLTNNGVYYIQSQTSTRLGLTIRDGGYRIPITKGLTETGHKLVKLGNAALINIPLATNLVVGQPVIYTSTNLASNLAIKPSGYLTSGSTYYVEFANATHVSLASTPGGERIVIAQQASSGTQHTLSDASINTVTITATSTHSNVRFTPAGTLTNINTTATGTIANVSVYT